MHTYNLRMCDAITVKRSRESSITRIISTEICLSRFQFQNVFFLTIPTSAFTVMISLKRFLQIIHVSGRMTYTYINVGEYSLWSKTCNVPDAISTERVIHFTRC